MKHCWHDIGAQWDPDVKCCWCGKPKHERVRGNHGTALGQEVGMEDIDRTDEDCPERKGPFSAYDEGGTR